MNGFRFILAAAIAIVSLSCSIKAGAQPQSATRAVASPVGFTIVKLHDSLTGGTRRLFLSSTYDATMIVPKGNNKWLQREIINAYQIVNGRSPDTLISAMAVNPAFHKTNQADFDYYYEELLASNTDYAIDTLITQSRSNFGISYNKNGFVNINCYTESHMGDNVNGSEDYTYYCLDLMNQKHLHLADIITANTIQLRSIIVNAAVNQGVNALVAAELATTSRSGYASAFYFNDRGLLLSYNQVGNNRLNVYIPYAELRSYLRPDFAKRMNLK